MDYLTWSILLKLLTLKGDLVDTTQKYPRFNQIKGVK